LNLRKKIYYSKTENKEVKIFGFFAKFSWKLAERKHFKINSTENLRKITKKAKNIQMTIKGCLGFRGWKLISCTKTIILAYCGSSKRLKFNKITLFLNQPRRTPPLARLIRLVILQIVLQHITQPLSMLWLARLDDVTVATNKHLKPKTKKNIMFKMDYNRHVYTSCLILSFHLCKWEIKT
jgi:hypothetical protein